MFKISYYNGINTPYINVESPFGAYLYWYPHTTVSGSITFRSTTGFASTAAVSFERNSTVVFKSGSNVEFQSGSNVTGIHATFA